MARVRQVEGGNGIKGNDSYYRASGSRGFATGYICTLKYKNGAEMYFRDEVSNTYGEVSSWEMIDTIRN